MDVVSTASRTRYDVVIAGGGHNGLVAAAYLAQAGLSVLVAEAQPSFGGATQSIQVFDGMDARLSRYAYLVSLLPDRIVRELGLRLECRSRQVASYTPVIRDGRHDGLLVGRGGAHAAETAASFARVCGTGAQAEFDALNDRVARLAARVAPMMLGPLPSAAAVRGLSGDPELWDALTARPLAELLQGSISDDLLRGIVGTDGVIGTFASLADASLDANRCYLYHVIGNGTGEWKVPVGGMGALVESLLEVCAARGVELVSRAQVMRVELDEAEPVLELATGQRISARWVLWGGAPQALEEATFGRRLAGVARSEGCQMKLNLLLTRLPKLASGMDPRIAFAGTFHVDESYTELEAAYAQAAMGQVPERLPFELYCHSLTDPTILGAELAAAGYHTLTLFGMHTPASLFDAENDGLRAELTRRYLASLNQYLAEPIEECLARDIHGELCIDAHTPLDLEAEIGLPRGNIFHTPLEFPVAVAEDEVGGWGVDTEYPQILWCGAAARRGGGVSGIPGQNAAMAVLVAERQRALVG